jgi:hypothetical protein
MSFVEQVRMINGHADIFACDGSAAHGVLLALGGPRLHLLVGGVASPDYFLSSTVAGVPATFINCLEHRDGPTLGRSFPHLVDLKKIAKYLRGHGFLKNDSRAKTAARSKVLRRRHDEVWYCRLVRAAGEDRSLSPADEREARRLATTSWPLSWLLLRYDLPREDTLVEDLASQFTDLLAAERDPDRVAHYRREITLSAASVLPALADRCGSDVIDRLTCLLIKHVMVKLPEGVKAN